jgi:hypothetical protein
VKYIYEGPGPQDDGDGGIVRPGDVRDFGQEPDWGPWRLADDPVADAPSPAPGAEMPAESPATLAPAPAPGSPAAASTAPPAAKEA